MKHFILVLLLAGCERLGPRVDDVFTDAPAAVPPDGSVDGPPPSSFLLPAGSIVPHSGNNPGMLAQIRLNDGLSDNAIAMNGGVLARTAGKSGGVPIFFWNFGAAPVAGNFAIVSPVYVLLDLDGITPIAHPMLLDSIPGDSSYSQVRRIIHIPITATYAGELLTSSAAIGEALDRGIISEPVPAGTWRSLPVVPHDIKLDVGPSAPPVAPLEVYAAGHIVTAFPLGGAFAIQPLRNGGVPLGQESRLLSGVATGTPPVLPTTADAQPVFQYPIPTVAPTTTPNYTPLTTQIDVRLVTGLAPTAITDDVQLFRRSTAITGSINGFITDTVATFTITTNVTMRHIQFQEGMP